MLERPRWFKTFKPFKSVKPSDNRGSPERRTAVERLERFELFTESDPTTSRRKRFALSFGTESTTEFEFERQVNAAPARLKPPRWRRHFGLEYSTPFC
jgi:hypothetical protein